MKEHIISYVIDGTGYWTGLNLTNHSYNNTSVLLNYYGPDGIKIKSEEIKITTGNQKTFMIDIPYRGWIRAISDDNLTINEYVGDYNSQSVVPIEKRDVVVRDVCNLNPGVVKIEETTFIHDCSQTNHYLTNGYWDVLKLLARWMHYRYPDRIAQKLEIVDASTDTGIAEGHPSGSHMNGMDCDFCYYTLEATNHTQWSSACQDSVVLLNEDSFDAERNVDLIIKLNYLFPYSQIISYIGYKDMLETAAWRMYGNVMRDKFSDNNFIQYDTGTESNHDKHLHVGLGGSQAEINGYIEFGIY